MIVKFSGKKISDQKRLVRGEQLLLARSYLRARDKTHHARWRVLTLAGGSPRGEITAIRELMAKAHIVAVDRDPQCLDAAIDAGVDDVVQCDLADWSDAQVTRNRFDYEAKKHQSITEAVPQAAAPRSIAKLGPFDLILLDLCGGVNDITRLIFQRYKKLLTLRGVMVLTFSYGRDVVEMFVEALEHFRDLSANSSSEGQQERRLHILDEFTRAEIPDLLAGRLMYLFPASDLERVASIMVYRGNEMPMCSCLFSTSRLARLRPLSYVQVEPGDFELVVAYPDAAKLYDCPQDRIESLRRQFAAIKAVITRRAESEPRAGQLFGDDGG